MEKRDIINKIYVQNSTKSAFIGWTKYLEEAIKNNIPWQIKRAEEKLKGLKK